MNDATERFLREIAAHVGAEHVAEVHLFPPLRQGPVESGVAVVAATPSPGEPGSSRHVVYSARYRSTVKGPDRGRWEAHVTAEADAPLLTVDEVVRGVMRRSGEELVPERIPGDAFRSLVAAQADLPVAARPAP